MNRRKLKKSVKRQLDGLIMIFIAAFCLASEADGAAVIIGFYGIACLFSTDKRRHSVIYYLAKSIVDVEDRGNDGESA